MIIHELFNLLETSDWKLEIIYGFSTIQLMNQDQPNTLPPTVLVIFGVTGDLTQKKLLPAIYQLFKNNQLPLYFKLVGFARRPWNQTDFIEYVHASLNQPNTGFDQASWQQFQQRLVYLQSEFENQEGYKQLEDLFKQAASEAGQPINRIYYFATPPSLYNSLLDQLKTVNLTKNKHGIVRVVVEKPFGHDLASAKKLSDQFLAAFSEEQIYRIDHYLGKETVQNILAFRFANSIFENLWCSDFIDHIQITAAEEIGIENRGAFYEETGALRDFFQNHLLQLLAAITMEQPTNLSAEAIRSERIKLLESIQPIENIASNTVRGQYNGYTSEPKVNADSKIETFVAAKLFISNEKFRNVPIYMRTGKKMGNMGKLTDITVQFKKADNSLFATVTPTMPNTLTIRIQPTEGISLRLFTKQPGHGNTIVPSQMDFCYRDTFGGAGADAYTRLLFDVITGDQTLFINTREVLAQWQFVTPLLELWQQSNQQVIPYEQGSWGPKESFELIERDNRQWLAEHLTVCPIHEHHTVLNKH